MRVLVVEDHGETRRALIKLVERWGCRVVAAAADVQTALHFVETKEFDVLISDIGLPDGTGFAVMAATRQHKPGVIGVAISAFTSPIELQIAQRAGFARVMRKPVDAQQLRAFLNSVESAAARAA